jgi:hypothetical protein
MWKKTIKTIVVGIFLVCCGVTAGGVKWGAPMIENLVMETAPENAITCGENVILVKQDLNNDYRIYVRSNNKWALAMENFIIRNEGVEQTRDAGGKWIGKGKWVIDCHVGDDATVIIIEPDNLSKLLDKDSDSPTSFTRTVGTYNAIWNKKTKCIYPIEGQIEVIDKGNIYGKGMVYRIKIDAVNGLDMSKWQVENTAILRQCGVSRTPWLVPNIIGNNVTAGIEILIRKMGPWNAIILYLAVVLSTTGMANGYISGRNRLLKEDKEMQIAELKKEYANKPDELAIKIEKMVNTFNEMKLSGWFNISAKTMEIYFMFFVVDYVGAFRGVTLGANDLGLPENCGLGNLGGLWNGLAKYLPRTGFFTLLLILVLTNAKDLEDELGNMNKWIMAFIFLLIFGNRSLVSILVYIVYGIFKSGINNLFYLLERRKAIRRVL